MTAGAAPKLMKSERLSSSAPKLDVAFNRRARRPSSPSKMPAAMIANTAYSNWPFTAKRIAVIPAHNASSVRIFGTMRLTENGAIRRTRGRRIRIRPERIPFPFRVNPLAPQSSVRPTPQCATPPRSGSGACRSASTVSPAIVRCPTATSGR